MKKNVQFVPQRLISDPQALKEELEWIQLRMINTHDTIVRILNFPIEEGLYKKNEIIKTKKDRNLAIESLMKDLQEKRTENSCDYYRKLEKTAEKGNINAILFMESLVTYINQIGTRIHDLEKELKERN